MIKHLWYKLIWEYPHYVCGLEFFLLLRMHILFIFRFYKANVRMPQFSILIYQYLIYIKQRILTQWELQKLNIFIFLTQLKTLNILTANYSRKNNWRNTIFEIISLSPKLCHIWVIFVSNYLFLQTFNCSGFLWRLIIAFFLFLKELLCRNQMIVELSNEFFVFDGIRINIFLGVLEI